MFHQCPEEHIQVACADRVEEQGFHDMQEQVEEQVFHEDQEKHNSHVVPEMCIDEITEEDMMRKLLVHEGVGNGGEAGLVVH